MSLAQLYIMPSAVILGVEMRRLEEPIYESTVKPDWKRKVYES